MGTAALVMSAGRIHTNNDPSSLTTCSSFICRLATSLASRTRTTLNRYFRTLHGSIAGASQRRHRRSLCSSACALGAAPLEMLIASG